MNAILRWIERHPALRDYIEGASMVLAPDPPPPDRRLYNDVDVLGLVSDMHAVGRDMRKAIDEWEEHAGHRR